MNTVEPVREFDMILNIMDYFKGRSDRNYVLFIFGIYVPMRISDILKLKVRDVRGKKFIDVREDKTSKEQLMPINKELRKVLDEYIKNMNDYDYLFESRQKDDSGQRKPISRQQAWNIMKQVASEFNLEKIGCHTLRKTFGYHHYQQNKDIVTLQDIFGHSDVSITKRYIGLTQQMKNEAIMNFKYGKT